MDTTLEYYNINAEAFRERTRGNEMGALYEAFVAHLSPGAHILDAGCGPGRDSAEFLRRGYRVTGIDGSEAMVEMASRATGQKVELMSFQSVDFDNEFDGVWANASLLHVPRGEIDEVIERLTRALKVGGVWYMSFKLGEGEHVNADGRLFNDYNEASLRELIRKHPKLEVIRIHQTPDGNPAVPFWLHGLVRKAARQSDRPF